MYKITNKMKDVRKFRDGFLGKDIFVEPGKSVFTKKIIEESDVFKVENVENIDHIEQLEKKKINIREVKK